jgi:hypothetical protein
MAFYLAFLFKHEKLEEKKSQNIVFFFFLLFALRLDQRDEQLSSERKR